MAPDLPLLRGRAARGRPGPGGEGRALRPVVLLAVWRRSIAPLYRMGSDLSGEKKRRTKFNRPIKVAQTPARTRWFERKASRVGAFAQNGSQERVMADLFDPTRYAAVRRPLLEASTL